MARIEGRPGRRRTAWPPVLLLGSLLLLTPLPALARGEKTVFQSQPLEWDPEFRRDGPVASLDFVPAWTFGGFHAPLAGDPAVDGDLLLASSQDGEVAALDPARGEARWKTRLPDALTLGPLALAGRVYQATREGRLLSLDGNDGRILWTTDLGSAAAYTPRPIGSRLLVATTGQRLLALDPADGRLLAGRPLPGRPTTPPVEAPGSILIGTEHGIVLALDRETLGVLWQRYTGQAITAPPLFNARRVYVASADRTLRCLRFRSGRPLWMIRTGAILTASPFTLGPYLYLLCYDNDIYVLKARNGHLMTRVRMGHRLDVSSAHAVDHLFVVPFTEAALVSLALPGLQAAGRYALDIPGEWFTTAPVVIGERVAVGYGRSEGRVLALTMSEAQAKNKAERAAGSP
ncbi:MAG TPA: PQQ-binding-like beta-propeller repeat protein [Candidatus Polarisedimenticolia bacterium]|nr:PQQ-binding-like beta-propeller repeat protein [Candidatus Polarisedimenticolia bacterium]